MQSIERNQNNNNSNIFSKNIITRNSFKNHYLMSKSDAFLVLNVNNIRFMMFNVPKIWLNTRLSFQRQISVGQIKLMRSL